MGVALRVPAALQALLRFRAFGQTFRQTFVCPFNLSIFLTAGAGVKHVGSMNRHQSREALVDVHSCSPSLRQSIPSLRQPLQAPLRWRAVELAFFEFAFSKMTFRYQRLPDGMTMSRSKKA